MHAYLNWKLNSIKVFSFIFLFFLAVVLASILNNLLLKFGINARLSDLLLLSILASLIAVPIGLLVGIILEEYFTPYEKTKVIHDALLNFTALPSVVYALIVLAFISGLFSLNAGILTGSLTLAICIAPVMIHSTRMAISAVPKKMRIAALALGATRWQRIRHILFPFALSAILSGVLRTFSLGIGLSGPLLLIGSFLEDSAISNSEQNHLGRITFEFKDIVHSASDFFSGNNPDILILLIISIVLNLIAIRISRRSLQKRAVNHIRD